MRHREQGALLRRLQAFVSGADDARYVALATATSRAFAFQEAASTLVYDALMTKVGPRTRPPLPVSVLLCRALALPV